MVYGKLNGVVVISYYEKYARLVQFGEIFELDLATLKSDGVRIFAIRDEL